MTHLAIRAIRLFAVLFVLPFSACVGFGDFQSARLAGPGNTQLTPTASATWLRSGGSSERATHHLGLRVAHGGWAGVDATAGLEYVGTRDGGSAQWAVGAGPKVALVPERLALWLPFGVLFGREVETGRSLQTNPTLLFTFDASPDVEVTPSIKALVPLSGAIGEDYLLAVNLGLGWTPAGAAWTLRPEAGMIWHPDSFSEGRALHFGVGATIPLRR